MLCPFCAHDNIDGVDLCASCGSDLAGLDLPEEHRGFEGRLWSDRVGDFPLITPLAVTPDMTVADAVEAMRAKRHGCVLVTEGARLVGIFTERDVLTRVLRRGRDPRATPVAEVMTPDPYTLDAIDPPAYAVHRMVAQGLRHLPVYDGERLRGFISVRNVLRHLHDEVLGNGPPTAPS